MSETVTFHGVHVPVADVLKAAAEIQQRKQPKPVEPGLYRWSHATDADPFIGCSTIRRKNTDGSWDWSPAWGDKWKRCSRSARFIDDYVLSGLLVPLMPVEGVEYEGGDGYRRRWVDGRWLVWVCGAWLPPADLWAVTIADGDRFWRTGQLRPVTSQPWTPKKGEWVNHKSWSKPRIVTAVYGDMAEVEGVCWAANILRPATPDEITAAKRIEVKHRLIVRSKANGSVWQYLVRRDSAIWHQLSENSEDIHSEVLDLDHYDILDEYVVQGAKR